MKLAFAIATIAALRQADIARADCDFGSNYTFSFNSSDYCSFDVGFGRILSSTSTTTSSGDTNMTTTTNHRYYAIWKVGDKESTVQCYPNITVDVVETAYPNGSTLTVFTGDFYLGLGSTNDTVADGVSLSSPGLYYFEGGLAEVWSDKDGNWDYITDAEGDITNLCEVLGGGAAPAPTPTPPTTEAPAPATDSSVGDSTVGTITMDSDGNIVGSYGDGASGTVDIENSDFTYYNGGKVATLARTIMTALLVGAAAFATI